MLRNAGYTVSADEATYLDADEQATDQFVRAMLTTELHAPTINDDYSRQLVIAGQELLRIASVDRVWLRVDLYGDRAQVARPGRLVEATVPAVPDQVFRGRIATVAPSVEGATQAAAARVPLDNPGGRLLPGENGPVALFMYQSQNGRRLTLYVRTEASRNRETAFRYARENNVGVFYWIDREVGYACASADLSKDELLRIANLVYKQLEP